MKYIRNIIINLVLILIIGMLTGCANSTEPAIKDASDLNQTKSLRIGGSSDYFTDKVAYLKGFLNDELGEDFTIELNGSVAGPAAVEAIIAGEIDLAILGDSPIVQAYSNNADIKIISTLWTSDDTYALVAGNNSEIESLADLKGKKIGYKAGSNEHQLLFKYLKEQNLTEADVTLINLDSTERLAALISGDCDAVMASQPSVDTWVEQSGGKVVATNNGYGTAGVFVIVNNEYAKQNPDVLAKVLKVFNETNEWMEQNKEEAWELLADYKGADVEITRKYYETREWNITWNDNLTSTIENTIDFAYEIGNITDKFDAKDLIDTSYLEKAGLLEK